MNTEKNKLKLYVIVGILAVASLLFRIINATHFEQTSILFVGLPALITVLVIKFAPPSKSLYGFVFKIITLFLLMSSILFAEGIVCILFAAPIFYGISGLLVYIYEFFKKRDNKTYSLVAIPVALILLIQPTGIKTDPEIQTVSVTQKVSHKISLSDFNKSPDFQLNYPSLFKIGFPKPLDITGSGFNVGDIRNIRFESSTKGIAL